MPPIKLIIIGAGSRGANYAEYAISHPDQAQVVGVADPREHYRTQLAARHGIPSGSVFADWRQVAERPRFADAVIVATPDALHAEPAIAFAEQGYHILLEKPMAPNAADCRRIAAAAQANGAMFAVCHVLRYTTYTKKVKEIVTSGRLGEIVSIQHLEPVGFWHQAHSFVRGNWRSEAESSFMLLAKSCHDLDWIRHIMGKRCTQVSSFGSLLHFRPENRPAGRGRPLPGLRCGGVLPLLGAAHLPDRPAPRHHRLAAQCAHAGRERGGPAGGAAHRAVRPLRLRLRQRRGGSPGGQHAVRGRRVGVLHHDRVHPPARPRTRIFGTRGELTGNGRFIEVYDFLTDTTERIDAETASDGSILSGHGGGDLALMTHFVGALLKDDPSLILSGSDESLESHLMVFAAEQARREGRVVEVGR